MQPLQNVAGLFLNMAKKIENSDGFTFHGWMVNVLHLEGGDLLAFALVHQFCQSRAGIYTGNTAYLSAWTGWSERTSRSHLLALQERGLIVEKRGREDNSPYCHYELAPTFYEMLKSTPQKLQGDPAKNDKSTPQKTTKAPRKNCGENISIEYNSLNIIPPTPQAVADYVRNMVKDPEGFALYYTTSMAANEWMRGKGKDRKPVTNWKNNVLQWVKYHKNEDFSYLKPVATKGSTVLSTEEFHKMLNI